MLSIQHQMNDVTLFLAKWRCSLKRKRSQQINSVRLLMPPARLLFENVIIRLNRKITLELFIWEAFLSLLGNEWSITAKSRTMLKVQIDWFHISNGWKNPWGRRSQVSHKIKYTLSFKRKNKVEKQPLHSFPDSSRFCRILQLKRTKLFEYSIDWLDPKLRPLRCKRILSLKS